MKTFNDLKFKKHPLGNGIQAKIEITPNVFMSVIAGEGFYSTSKDGSKKSTYQQGVELSLSSIQRNSVKALDPQIKSGNYLNNMLAHREAKQKNIYDAIMLNEHGEITEGPTFNLFFVKDGVFQTPHLPSGLLKGITRRVLIDALRKSGQQVIEGPLTMDDLRAADEAFTCSSTKELVPIIKVDAKVFGPEPGANFKLAREIYQAYRDERLQQDNLGF